jgi:hypothetical protein
MMRRVAALLATATLVALALSGCVLTDPYVNKPSDGGQASAVVVAELEAMPGVSNAGFRLDPWDNPGEGGLFSSSGVNFLLLVDVEPGYRIADPAAFLDQALRALWSINDGYSPKGGISIHLRGGTDVDHDWETDVLELLGYGRPSVDREGRETGIRLTLNDDVLRDQWGDWPGEPSGFASGLVVAGSPVDVDPAAISDLSYAGITSGEDCWSFSFQLGVSDADVVYPGDVTVTLLVGDEEEATQVARAADRDPDDLNDGVEFCYDERKPGNFDNVGFRVSTDDVEGFRTVEIDRFDRG